MVYMLDGRVYYSARCISWMTVCTILYGLKVGWSFVTVCMVFKLHSRFVIVCMVYRLDRQLYQCASFTSWMVGCTSVYGLHVG